MTCERSSSLFLCLPRSHATSACAMCSVVFHCVVVLRARTRAPGGTFSVAASREPRGQLRSGWKRTGFWFSTCGCSGPCAYEKTLCHRATTGVEKNAVQRRQAQARRGPSAPNTKPSGSAIAAAAPATPPPLPAGAVAPQAHLNPF